MDGGFYNAEGGVGGPDLAGFGDVLDGVFVAALLGSDVS